MQGLDYLHANRIVHGATFRTLQYHPSSIPATEGIFWHCWICASGKCCHAHSDACTQTWSGRLRQLTHDHVCVPGDCKPDNLLLGADGHVKISDFGSSRMLGGGDAAMMLRAVGTPAFLAPEVCAGLPYHGRCADLWALGICLYCFIYGALAAARVCTAMTQKSSVFLCRPPS